MIDEEEEEENIPDWNVYKFLTCFQPCQIVFDKELLIHEIAFFGYGCFQNFLYSSVFFFIDYPHDAMHKRGLGCRRVSVCPSVARRYCV